MIHHLWEHFLKKIALFQVYDFWWILGHIWWHHAKVFYLFDLFWISNAGFNIRSTRGTWPFLARGWILQISWCISDEIGTCVPKYDFFKKSWENYEAPIVQIWPPSSWIGMNLSFLREVDGNCLTHNHLVLCKYMWSSIFK